MIQGGNAGHDAAHFGGREHHGQFELGLARTSSQFVRPDTFEGFFPEQLDGADGLGAGLAGDFFVALEMDAVLQKGRSRQTGKRADAGRQKGEDYLPSIERKICQHPFTPGPTPAMGDCQAQGAFLVLLFFFSC